MGIPGIFRELSKKHKSIIRKVKNVVEEREIDFLFFDFNCLVYHVLRKIEKTHQDLLEKGKITKFENELIKGVNEYLEEIICDVVKPTKLVYIAVDGVVPRGKMLQQRTRRFKKIKDFRELEEPLKKKHGITTKIWNNSAISPGTEFMKKLSKAIKKAIEEDKFCRHAKIRIIFSDSSVPGEGEHKIYPYIRQIKCTDDCRFVIYGLDGDLMVLSMLTEKKHVYLLREPANATSLVKEMQEEPFILIDIMDLFDKLKAEFGGEKGFRGDFTLISFFGGNDFVRNLPHTRVRERAGKADGLTYMLDCYKRIRDDFDEPLVSIGSYDDHPANPVINTAFLKALFAEFGKGESYRLRGLDMRRKNDKPFNRPDDENKTEYQKEYDLYYRTEYIKVTHPEREKYFTLLNRVNYSAPRDVWKDEYYKLFFDVSPKEQKIEFMKMINEATNNYLKTIVWSLKYYFDGLPPSWDYFYPFRVSPFASDIQRTLNRIKNINTHYRFELGHPMQPLQQLLFILPPQNNTLLPRPLRTLTTSTTSPILDMYPIDFDLDVVDGLKREYSEALLPEPEFDRLIEAYDVVAKKHNLGNHISNKMNKRGEYFNFKCSTTKKKGEKKIKIKKIKIKKNK